MLAGDTEEAAAPAGETQSTVAASLKYSVCYHFLHGKRGWFFVRGVGFFLGGGWWVFSLPPRRTQVGKGRSKKSSDCKSVLFLFPAGVPVSISRAFASVL